MCSGRDSPSHLHDVGGVRVVSRRGRDQAGWGGRGTGDALGCNAVESWGRKYKKKKKMYAMKQLKKELWDREVIIYSPLTEPQHRR